MAENEKKPPVIREEQLIAPATPERVLEAMKRFQDFKARVLDKDDYVVIKTREGPKQYVRKSGWLKYALACNISLQKLEERSEVVQEGGKTVYSFTYRAIAPNGRYTDAVGSASSDEREFTHVDHDPRALAQTRAMNRAISNLIAGGEVSAEEVAEEEAVPPEGTLIQSSLKDLAEWVEVDDQQDATHIRIKSNMPDAQFNDLRLRAALLGFEYIPASRGGPEFRREKRSK